MTTAKSITPLQGSDYEHITLLNQLKSPLLRLPAELRNKIYALVFSCEAAEFVTHLPQQLFRSKYAKIIGPAALLLTSRQLYAETNILFFQTSIFDLRHIYWCKHTLKAKTIMRCNIMESILLGKPDLIDMRTGFWQEQTSQLKFGALRRVHLRMSPPMDPMQQNRMEDELREVLGKGELEVVWEAMDERISHI